MKTTRKTAVGSLLGVALLALGGCASAAPDHIVFVGDPFADRSGAITLAAGDTLGGMIHSADIILAARLADERAPMVADVPEQDAGR